MLKVLIIDFSCTLKMLIYVEESVKLADWFITRKSKKFITMKKGLTRIKDSYCIMLNLPLNILTNGDGLLIVKELQ